MTLLASMEWLIAAGIYLVVASFLALVSWIALRRTRSEGLRIILSTCVLFFSLIAVFFGAMFLH